jgi:hypothetical protein
MRRRTYAIVCLFLLLSVLLSGISTSRSSGENRAWVPKLDITSIELTHSNDEPTEFGEYVNKTREVKVTIENTGKIVLTNIDISYKVKRGFALDISGSDDSKTKLRIGESYEMKFDWTPLFAQGTYYVINITVTADNFGNSFGPIYLEKGFIIRDVKKDVGPVTFKFEAPNAVMGAEFSNSSHKLTVVVKNFGNFRLTTSFPVEATIYSSITMQQLWTDSKTHSSQILANGLAEITFNNWWKPIDVGLYLLSIQTSLAGDVNPGNNNISWIPLEINNVTDAGIVQIKNLEDGAMYPCTPVTVACEIGNTGNQNITSDFNAILNINSYPDGSSLFTPAPILVPVTGSQNISEPGNKYTVTFPTWGFTEGLKPGKVWINVSITPGEVNGSISNNDYSIMIELINQTFIQLKIISPAEGKHYINDITEIKVNASNIGTKDLSAYVVNLTLKNLDTGENAAFIPGQTNSLGLAMDSYKVHNFNGPLLDYNAKFELNASLARVATPGNVIALVSRVFQLAGGAENGTITGSVFGITEGKGLENIIVDFYLQLVPTPVLIDSTITGAGGVYTVELPAAPEGKDYSVSISSKKNYWWFDKNSEIQIYSGRIKNLNLDLSSRPTGTLDGNVQFTSNPIVPDVEEDWTGVTITVEDTPIEISPSVGGDFNVILVAGSLNVSAKKDNFETDRREYVTIVPDQTTDVQFTLMEKWSVALTPLNHEQEVDPRNDIIANFDTPLDKNTVSPQTFGLLDDNGKLVTGLGTVNYQFYKDDKTCRLSPPKVLDYDTTYHVVLTQGILTIDGDPAIHRRWQTSFATYIGEGTVVGYCTYYWSRMPIKDAEIGLTNIGLGDTEPEFNTTTDENGYYFFNGVQAGDYELNVTVPGKQPRLVHINVLPDEVIWSNITFQDELPVPRLWGNNEFGRKILIESGITDKIKADTDFTLTSNIPLDPETVNVSTIRIIEKSSWQAMEFKTVIWSQNRLSFIIELQKSLKYNSTYQVLYKKELRTYDARMIFTSDWIYCNFTTEEHSWRELSTPNINPPNNAVNIPINDDISIDFPVPMNKSSVENLIDATFNITGFIWLDENITVNIQHENFDYSTVYNLTLKSGMISETGLYRLINPVKVSFTTIPGFEKIQIFGPILDSDSKPVNKTSIYIYDVIGNLLEIGITNSSGYATLYFETSLEPGNYTLRIVNPDYEMETVEFIVDPFGNPIFEGPLPKLQKIITLGVALIVILVIVFIAIAYLIVFKNKFLKQPGDEPAKDKDKKEQGTRDTTDTSSKPDKERSEKTKKTSREGKAQKKDQSDRSKPDEKENDEPPTKLELL